MTVLTRSSTAATVDYWIFSTFRDVQPQIQLTPVSRSSHEISHRIHDDETAAATVEYAVMVAMILMTALAGIAYVGQQTGVMYGDIVTEMDKHGIN